LIWGNTYVILLLLKYWKFNCVKKKIKNCNKCKVQWKTLNWTLKTMLIYNVKTIKAKEKIADYTDNLHSATSRSPQNRDVQMDRNLCCRY
jgi:hypothetical protein